MSAPEEKANLEKVVKEEACGPSGCGKIGNPFTYSAIGVTAVLLPTLYFANDIFGKENVDSYLQFMTATDAGQGISLLVSAGLTGLAAKNTYRSIKKGHVGRSLAHLVPAALFGAAALFPVVYFVDKYF